MERKSLPFRSLQVKPGRINNLEKEKKKLNGTELQFFNDGLAEIAEQHVKKGSKVFVSGELRTSKWGEAGAEKYSTDVVFAGISS